MYKLHLSNRASDMTVSADSCEQMNGCQFFKKTMLCL